MKTIRYFSKFLYRLFLKIIHHEMVFAEKEKVEKRRKTCNGCDLIDRHWYGDRCSICTCFVRRKSQFEFEECPEEKWED